MFIRLSAMALGLGLATAACSSLPDVPNPFEDTPNPGPCPAAFALYDASRLVELAGEDVTYENVAFTGEFERVHSFCEYSDDDPIIADLEVDLGFGRGPAAQGDRHTYTIFVAVTRSETTVIERQEFPIEVRFDDDEDRTYIRQRFDRIEIPRAHENISGSNFEILVGFVLTDEQLEFNRRGLRFRVDAGQ